MTPEEAKTLAQYVSHTLDQTITHIVDHSGIPNEDPARLALWEAGSRFQFCLQAFLQGCEIRKCRVCGCTWDNACAGGCAWVEKDLCSECVRRA